jgi:hypothetical protein
MVECLPSMCEALGLIPFMVMAVGESLWLLCCQREAKEEGDQFYVRRSPQ